MQCKIFKNVLPTEKLCKSLQFLFLAKFLAAGTKSLVWKLDEMEKCAQGPIAC